MGSYEYGVFFSPQQPEMTGMTNTDVTRPGHGSMVTPNKMDSSFGRGGGGANLGLGGHQQQVSGLGSFNGTNFLFLCLKGRLSHSLVFVYIWGCD